MSPDYGVEEECILKGDGEMGGAYIVRLPAGDSDIYLRRVDQGFRVQVHRRGSAMSEVKSVNTQKEDTAWLACRSVFWLQICSHWAHGATNSGKHARNG